MNRPEPRRPPPLATVMSVLTVCVLPMFLLASAGTTAVLLALPFTPGGGLLFVLAMVAVGFLYSLATCAGNTVLSGFGGGLVFSVKQAAVPLAGLVAGVIAATFAGGGWRVCVAAAVAGANAPAPWSSSSGTSSASAAGSSRACWRTGCRPVTSC